MQKKYKYTALDEACNDEDFKGLERYGALKYGHTNMGNNANLDAI